jgi:hypothetical protein
MNCALRKSQIKVRTDTGRRLFMGQLPFAFVSLTCGGSFDKHNYLCFLASPDCGNGAFHVASGSQRK